jgi:succinate dehydrogenase / fumarate reductase cytochrome b subunit
LAAPVRTFLLHTGPSRDRHSGTHAGWWAWLLQRVTGVALVGYLFLHVALISTGQAGADTFDDVLKVLQTPVFVALDLLLLAAVLYHGLNGLRVVLLDLGIGIRRQAALFWACLALTLVTTGAATYFSFPLIF